MIRLAFLRHGYTGWNREGRIQGRTDRPLDAAARVELLQTAPPAGWEDAELIASPLRRAKDTAEIVFGRQAKIEPALIEMDWGDLEGRKRADIQIDPNCDLPPIERWGWEFQPPGGEKLSEVRERLLDWMQGLDRRKTDKVVAVSHIGVMRVALALATGWGFSGAAPFRVGRKKLYPVLLDPSGAPTHLEEVIRLESRLSSTP